MKSIEVAAKTVEQAIEKGLEQLGLARERVEVKILSEGGGLFSKAKVVLTQKRTEGERAQEFLEGLLERLGKTMSTVELVEDASEARLNIIGTDTATLIGRHGETLDGLNHILSVVANGENEKYKRIILDCDNYRAKQDEKLIATALSMAERAKADASRLRLPPMNSAERRIVHATLSEVPGITTQSEGIEPHRHVVIVPSNYKAPPKPHYMSESMSDRAASKPYHKRNHTRHFGGKK